MDISETWKKLEKEKLERPIEGDFQKGKSKHPVERLKQNYFIKTIMMVVFLLCFAGMFLYFDQLLIKVTLGVLVAAYAIFLVSSYLMYKNIKSDVSMDRSLITVLTETKERVSRGVRFETTSSMIIFPFAATAGYMMGYTVSGNDINNIFNSTTQILIFTAVLVVFMVLGYFLGRKLTREGYGKYLDQIGGMIEQLKA